METVRFCWRDREQFLSHNFDVVCQVFGGCCSISEARRCGDCRGSCCPPPLPPAPRSSFWLLPSICHMSVLAHILTSIAGCQNTCCRGSRAQATRGRLALHVGEFFVLVMHCVFQCQAEQAESERAAEKMRAKRERVRQLSCLSTSNLLRARVRGLIFTLCASGPQTRTAQSV